MHILKRAYPPLFEASDLREVAGAPSSNVSDMMTLMFSGKVLGIQEVAPFWWESTKNSSIESTGTRICKNYQASTSWGQGPLGMGWKTPFLLYLFLYIFYSYYPWYQGTIWCQFSFPAPQPNGSSELSVRSLPVLVAKRGQIFKKSELSSCLV